MMRIEGRRARLPLYSDPDLAAADHLCDDWAERNPRRHAGTVFGSQEATTLPWRTTDYYPAYDANGADGPLEASLTTTKRRRPLPVVTCRQPRANWVMVDLAARPTRTSRNSRRFCRVFRHPARRAGRTHRRQHHDFQQHRQEGVSAGAVGTARARPGRRDHRGNRVSQADLPTRVPIEALIGTKRFCQRSDGSPNLRPARRRVQCAGRPGDEGDQGHANPQQVDELLNEEARSAGFSGMKTWLPGGVFVSTDVGSLRPATGHSSQRKQAACPRLGTFRS